MAIVKKSEIEGMSVTDLKKKIEEIRKDLMKENAQVARGTSLKSPGQMRAYKRTIARMLTLIKQKEKKTLTSKKEEKKEKPKKEVQDG